MTTKLTPRDRERERERAALREINKAKLKKLEGYPLTSEELRLLKLPQPPDWVLLWDALARIPDNPKRISAWREKAIETMLVLIGSEVPLSSPTRMDLCDLLWDYCLLSSARGRRQRRKEQREDARDLAQILDGEIQELLNRHVGMSKATAERLTAEKYTISVDALRKKRQRARH